VEHLEHCGGNAVIVFDEVQKVLPGTLEVRYILAFPTPKCPHHFVWAFKLSAV
jgi:hypothetical protein